MKNAKHRLKAFLLRLGLAGRLNGPGASSSQRRGAAPVSA
jgi:hypothetical protein